MKPASLRASSKKLPLAGFLPWLLLLAFAMSGWKVWKRESSPDFHPLTQAAVAPASTPKFAKSDGALAAKRSPVVQHPDKRLIFDAGFISAAPGQAVHAPSIVELANGSLRAVWFSGSREGARDVTIQSAVMDAASLRWGAESTLFERHQIERSLWRYVKKIGNPVIARAPDGSLHLWMVNVSLGGWAGSSLSWARSADDGATWSSPRRLVTSPFLNISTLVKGAPFAYANGQIGLPVYHEFVAKLGEVLRLDAEGRVTDKVRIAGSQGSLQPVVLVTGAKTAWAYLRSGTAAALIASHTDDAGKTWSLAQASQLPNPDSALAGLIGSDGTRWLALNPTTDNRETLALASSQGAIGMDVTSVWNVEASTQPERRLTITEYEALLGKELMAQGVAPEKTSAYIASARRQLCGPERCSQEFSYPYLLQSRDGHIHLVYTWHRTRIKHVRLDPVQFDGASDFAAAH